MRAVSTGIEVVDDTVKVREKERRVIDSAVRSITAQESFHELPTAVAGDIIIGYMRSTKRKLTRRIGLQMLVEDLEGITSVLRPKVWVLPGINDERGAALLYLAVAVGVDKVLKNLELWRALKAENYDLAEEIVLQMYWTFDVVQAKDKAGQKRIIGLARVMRTGEWPATDA